MDGYIIPFHITKASIDPDTGKKQWFATVSKFAVDKQGDEVTPEFYKSAIAAIQRGDVPSPSLVVSHFDDSRLDAASEPTPDVFVAGTTQQIYIDRDQPKASGVFEDTLLGNAAYNAIKADIANDVEHDERVRISMGFRPVEGGIEKSEDSTKYTNGIIRHFALTRVPIVPETAIVAKSNSEGTITRYDDASTIVGKELAAVLDEEYANIQLSKSDYEELLEKAGDFDMGACIEEVMGEGKPRKQALAICLSKSGKSKDKSTLHEEDDTMPETIQEKALSEGFNDCVTVMMDKGLNAKMARLACDGVQHKITKVNTAKLKSGHVTSKTIGDVARRGSTSSKEKLNTCIERLMGQGLNKEQATETCEARLSKRLGANKSEVYIEKRDLSLPLGDCITMYMEDDGFTREKAIETCSSKEAKAARAEANTEKADYENHELMELMNAILEDTELQVVKVEKSGTVTEEVTLDEKVDAIWDMILSDVNKELAGDEVTEKAVNSDKEVADEVVNLEPEVTADVNDASDLEKSESDKDMYVELTHKLKSVVDDPGLDRTAKNLMIEFTMEAMAKLAKADMQETTPVSDDDMATMIQKSLEEAIGPLATENDLLLNRVVELEEIVKGSLDPIANAPRPKQLKAKAQVASKASAQQKKGALSAREMANSTVVYSDDRAVI